MARPPWLSILLGDFSRVGYGRGDEARLLESHLQGTRAVIGVGSNRVEVANAVIRKHGLRDIHDILHSAKDLDFQKNSTDSYDVSDMDVPKLAQRGKLQPQGILDNKPGITECKDGMGVVLMDDGMQHWRVGRDIEIVMVNAISMFGNGRLLPRGPLRESLQALCRADLAVIHQANLVSAAKVLALKGKLRAFLPASAGIFCTQMVPRMLCHIQKNSCSHTGQAGVREGPAVSAPLSVLRNSHVLCISGIGCPESLRFTLEQLGTLFVECMDFPDHHHFEMEDLIAIKQRLRELKTKLEHDPVVVSTEKDYARSTSFFWRLKDYDVYILQSRLELTGDSSSAADFSNLIAMKLQRFRG